MCFLLFPVGEEWFSRRIPLGIFWGCKIDEILTLLSFFPWLSVWYCLFGFLLKSSQFSSQVFAKHGFICFDKCFESNKFFTLQGWLFQNIFYNLGIRNVLKQYNLLKVTVFVHNYVNVINVELFLLLQQKRLNCSVRLHVFQFNWRMLKYTPFIQALFQKNKKT